MAQIITARLARIDSQPWGFRLQGGKDFGTPLVIQKVHTGSIADKAGLQAGDAVVRINQVDLYNLRHKDAQDAIVQAGPSFELVIQRGGSTWKPTVTPISSAAASPIPGHYTPVTKTSLAANKQPVSAIGTGHNTAARPFVPPSPVRSIVNKQYNSPVAMYSDETIAETLTSQAEVLAGGCLGVNFKKNEKVYNPEKSEVLKALQENDSEPEPAGSTFYWRQSHAIGGSAVTSNSPRPLTPNYQVIPDSRIGTTLQQNALAPPASHRPSLPVQPVHPVPKTIPQSVPKAIPEETVAPQAPAAPPQISIDGVFVRIKDKNLHVECFKCATCGTSLKNQGYYNLHNKLYCDVHARLAAMNSPPPNSNGLVPVTIPPKNLGASTISSALNAHAGNLNGNPNQNECQASQVLATCKGTNVNDDNNNSIVCDNRSISETDCSSLSSSDKENDSRPSSSHNNNNSNINSKSDITNGKGPDGFQYRTMNGRVIKSVIAPGKGITVNYKVPSNISGPKPFSYTQSAPQLPSAVPPMAGPKSPSSYPPPSQPTWAPPSAAPAAPKPVGSAQEFIDIEKCNGKPREDENKKKKKKEEVTYVPPCDSDDEFDPIELAKIAKPPPSNFIWPPPIEEQKVPIAAPIYVPVPETLHVTAKPCTEVRPLGHHRQLRQQRLSTQNLLTIESVSTTQDVQCYNECLNVESNLTATTTTTSNASSESEYKMYQTQNNHYVNMFEKQQEQHEQHDDEVEEINKMQIEMNLPQTELPIVTEFVEPGEDYQAETFSNVFTKKKETWQKLTENVMTARREERKTVNLTVEATDDNPENSEVDDAQHEEDNEVEEINERSQEKEIEEVQHVGPYDGTYYQLAPSNIPQPVPKGYQTGLGKALVYSSDKPYSIRNMPPTPEPRYPCLDLYQRAVIEAEQFPEIQEQSAPKQQKEIPKFEVKTTTERREFPHDEQQVRRGSTLLSSMMRTASPRNIEFVKSNIIEEVPLPNEMNAYFPPPISMVPNEPYPSINSYRTKSPFVSALTTVSDRPFTPFGREIKSQLSLELPQATAPKTTFSNALHTAPDESFDPSSLIHQPVYDNSEPIEYTAKVYERITVDATAEEPLLEPYSHVEMFRAEHEQPKQRNYLPKMQPWSTPSDQIPQNVHKDSISSCHESVECMVSDSRRCSELASEPTCVKKNIHDLLKYDEPEEEFDPDKPCPNAPYPRRMEQPSPFDGMQVKVTNKMTCGLHKPDEIPQYQKKWFNLPTQNPPRTPEPEELRENVPVAFKEWHETKQIIASQTESIQRKEIRVTFAEKPPIPHDTPTNSRRGSVSEKIQWMEQSKAKVDQEPKHVSKPRVEEEVKFPRKLITEDDIKPRTDVPFPTKSNQLIESLFPTRKIYEESYDKEASDELQEMNFPFKALPTVPEGSFPMRGTRKNSIADIQERQQAQFERQKTLKQELELQQQRMQQKNKNRMQKELDNMQKNYEKMAQDTIKEEIQQNHQLSAYEQEQEYKRQLQLEKEQRKKEMEIKEQQAREIEYQRQLEEKKMQEIRFQEKRERDLHVQAQKEAEYRKHREEQDEYLRLQQEERDREMRRQQEEIEKEIHRQQEHERREAEQREAKRLFEIRMKEERDRELAKIEAELRIKREEELKRLEQEIREKREERKRAEAEAELKKQQDRKARELAEKEAKRIEEEAVREQKERERQLQAELKLRQKQEADRKQREEMELFNIEEEKKRNEELARKAKAYQSSTYQQQHIWPPSTSSTPAPNQQQSRQVPIIKTDSETELNATKFHFEPLDEEQKRFMAGIRPPSTCYSPPTDEKPYPSIPYYQQHLAFYETAPDHSGIFDPRSVSPAFRNRSKSPAFGPPPNPLRAFVNKERDPVVDESGIYLCGERLLSPIWYEKGNKKIPPPVQRRIHPHNPTAPHPPPKPDLEAIKESIKMKKMHETSTKPPPTPPPMPKTSYKATLPAVKNEAPEVKTNEIVTNTNNKESMIATDLLKESVDRLNINTQNSDFRKNASNVLAAMLEARMKKKQQLPTQPAGKFDDPEFLPPPPPIPSSKPQIYNNHDQDLPLPPPPSPCKIPSSILTPPLSSDENDLPQKKCHSNGSNNEKVNYRHRKHHHSNNQSPDSSPTSSFHGISKPELSTHARDRRSYIEKNNNGSSNGNHNEISFNNSVDKDTLDTIANGIANGQHPVCDKCKCKITRGPFVTALGRTWCPAHFLCVNQSCRRELMDIGFVEEKGDLYCEYCFEQFLAPPCSKCNGKIKGDCLNAIGRKFHPECFKCTYCGKLFGNNPFFLEEGEPYCEADWNELFTTKCFACGFPVEAGDRWVEALNNNYHSQCFNCTYCKKNLEGQSFFAKGGRPFCKNHAR